MTQLIPDVSTFRDQPIEGLVASLQALAEPLWLASSPGIRAIHTLTLPTPAGQA